MLEKPDPTNLFYVLYDEKSYRKSDAPPPGLYFLLELDWVRALLDEADEGIGTWEMWLAGEQVKRLTMDLERVLDERFEKFVHLDERRIHIFARINQIIEVAYKGHTYQLVYSLHREILALLEALEWVQNAADQEYSFRISQTSGLSMRQRHFLVFARDTRSSNRTVASFQQKFGAFLDGPEILETLEGLAKLGFLALEGEEVIFLEKAKELYV